MARPDRFARGSDHTSFSDRGYAAIAFREANENFEKQHSALDTWTESISLIWRRTRG